MGGMAPSSVSQSLPPSLPFPVPSCVIYLFSSLVPVTQMQNLWPYPFFDLITSFVPYAAASQVDLYCIHPTHCLIINVIVLTLVSLSLSLFFYLTWLLKP